jgi:hypothetical protein
MNKSASANKNAKPQKAALHLNYVKSMNKGAKSPI